MLGKSMRCTVCQEVFIVEPAVRRRQCRQTARRRRPRTAARGRGRTPLGLIAKRQRIRLRPVLQDVSPVAPPRPAVPPPPKPRESTWSDKVKPPTSGGLPVGRRSASRRKSAPKEVTWSPELELPTDRTPIANRSNWSSWTKSRSQRSESTARQLPHPRSGTGSPFLLSMLVFVVALLGAGASLAFGIYGRHRSGCSMPRSTSYEDGAYDQARGKFEQAHQRIPELPSIPEARFLAELSKVRHSDFVAQEPRRAAAGH